MRRELGSGDEVGCGTYVRYDKIFLWTKNVLLAPVDKRIRKKMKHWLTLTYMRLSTLVPRSSGNCCRHFSKNVLIASPFLHYTIFNPVKYHTQASNSKSPIKNYQHHTYISRTQIEKPTITLFRCPLPSQNE